MPSFGLPTQTNTNGFANTNFEWIVAYIPEQGREAYDYHTAELCFHLDCFTVSGT